jgi:DnaK suppressor protein
MPFLEKTTFMTQKERTELKEKIAEQMAETKRKIAEYKELTQPIAPENAIGRVSRMDAINNKAVIEAALREAERKLHNLEEVAKNVEKKEFGVCVKCHAPIPLGRLLLMPESRKCVNCAAK